jgi:hypothetical protein
MFLALITIVEMYMLILWDYNEQQNKWEVTSWCVTLPLLNSACPY